jgi:hypothetical protein
VCHLGHPYIRHGVSETVPKYLLRQAGPPHFKKPHKLYGFTLGMPYALLQLAGLNQSRLQRILEGICVTTNSLYGHLLSPLVCS